MAEDDLVTFLDAEGSEISNDPRWYARQQQVQVAEQQQNLADEDLDTEDNGYADMRGPELKKLAEERGLNLKGLTKKSQVIELLEADDAAKAEAEAQTEGSGD